MSKLTDYLDKEYGADQQGAVATAPVSPQPLKQPSKLSMFLESRYGAQATVTVPPAVPIPEVPLSLPATGVDPSGPPTLPAPLDFTVPPEKRKLPGPTYTGGTPRNIPISRGTGAARTEESIRKVADALGIPTPGEFGVYVQALRSGELDKDKKFARPGMELKETAARAKFAGDRVRKVLKPLQSKFRGAANTFFPLVSALSAMLDRLDRVDGPVTQESLALQAEEFTGAGGIVVPLTTDITAESLKWYFLGKAFEGVSGGAEVIKQMPQVQKAGKTIESMGGIQKIAETMPRTYQAGKNAVGAFVKGYVVGTGKGVFETMGEDDATIADYLVEANRQGLMFGTIALAFSTVSSVDQAIAIKRLRTQMTLRGLQQVRDLSKGLIRDPLGKGKIKSLQTFEDAMVKHVDDVVAAYEAELSGAIKGELFKNIRGKAPEAQKEITRFLKKGYDPGAPSFAGKTPMRPVKPRLDVLRGEPLTKAGEVVKAIKQPVKAIEKIGKAKVEAKVRPSAAEIKAKLPQKAPVEVVVPSKVTKAQEGVQEVAPTLNKMQQRNADALARVLKDHPQADNPAGTTKIRMTTPQGTDFQVPATDVEKKLGVGWALAEKEVVEPTTAPKPPAAKIEVAEEKVTEAEQAEYKKLKDDFSSYKFNTGSPEMNRLIELERKIEPKPKEIEREQEAIIEPAPGPAKTTAPITKAVVKKIKAHKAEILPRKDEILAQLDRAIEDAPEKRFYNEETFGKLNFNIDGGMTIVNHKEALRIVRKNVKALPEVEQRPMKPKPFILKVPTFRTPDQIFESIKEKISTGKAKSSIAADVRELHGAIPSVEFQIIERELNEIESKGQLTNLLPTVNLYQRAAKERSQPKLGAKKAARTAAAKEEKVPGKVTIPEKTGDFRKDVETFFGENNIDYRKTPISFTRINLKNGEVWRVINLPQWSEGGVEAIYEKDTKAKAPTPAEAKKPEKVISDPTVETPSVEGGFVGGRPGKAKAKISAIVKEDMKTTDAAESFLQRSKGFKPTKTRMTAIRWAWEFFKEFRFLPHIPKVQAFADVREAFRHLLEVAKLSYNTAVENMKYALKPVAGTSLEAKRRMEAVRRKLIADDLYEDVEKGVALPPGLKRSDVEAMKEKADFLYDKYPTVREAYDRIRAATQDVTDMLVEEGWLDSKLAKEMYFPHKVIRYLRQNDAFLGQARKPSEPRKGYLKQRKGGVDYSTDVLERLIEHWAQVRRDVATSRFLQKTLKSEQQNYFKQEFPEWKQGDEVPAGYKEVTVLPGRFYYKANGVSEDMAMALLVQNLEMIEQIMDEQNIKGKDTIRKILVVGKKRAYIVREPIARQMLDLPTQAISDLKAYKAITAFNTFVKRQILFNPLYVIPFNVTNFIGDGSKNFVALPSSLEPKYLVNYWKRIAEAHKGEKSQRFADAQEYGVIGSGWLGVDVKSMEALIPEIERAEISGGLKVVANKLKRLFNATRILGQSREDWLRYALFDRLMDIQDKGKDITKYAIKDVKVIRGLSNPTHKAAKVARDIAGDYSAIGKSGRMISDLVVPFYRWMHLNLPWWPRMIVEYSKRGDVGRLIAALLAALAPYILSFLWNYSDDDRRRFEQSLPPWKRWQFHIITLRGKKMYYSPLPLDDVINFIGLDDNILDFQRYQRGMISLKELVERIAINSAYQPGMSVINSIGGFFGVLRDAAGFQTFPEIKDYRITAVDRRAMNVIKTIFGAPGQLGQAIKRGDRPQKVNDLLWRSVLPVRPYSVDIEKTKELYRKSTYKADQKKYPYELSKWKPHKGKQRKVDSLKIQLERQE